MELNSNPRSYNNSAFGAILGLRLGKNFRISALNDFSNTLTTRNSETDAVIDEVLFSRFGFSVSNRFYRDYHLNLEYYFVIPEKDNGFDVNSIFANISFPLNF